MRLVRFTGPGGSPIFVNPASVAVLYADPTTVEASLTCIRMASDFQVFVQEDVTAVRDALCDVSYVQREQWTQTIRLGDMNK